MLERWQIPCNMVALCRLSGPPHNNKDFSWWPVPDPSHRWRHVPAYAITNKKFKLSCRGGRHLLSFIKIKELTLKLQTAIILGLVLSVWKIKCLQPTVTVTAGVSLQLPYTMLCRIIMQAKIWLGGAKPVGLGHRNQFSGPLLKDCCTGINNNKGPVD